MNSLSGHVGDSQHKTPLRWSKQSSELYSTFTMKFILSLLVPIFSITIKGSESIGDKTVIESNIVIEPQGFLEIYNAWRFEVSRAFVNHGDFRFCIMKEPETKDKIRGWSKCLMNLTKSFYNGGRFILDTTHKSTESNLIIASQDKVINEGKLSLFKRRPANAHNLNSDILIKSRNGIINRGDWLMSGESSSSIRICMDSVDLLTEDHAFYNVGRLCLQHAHLKPNIPTAGSGCLTLLQDSSLHLVGKFGIPGIQTIYLKPGEGTANIDIELSKDDAWMYLTIVGFREDCIINFKGGIGSQLKFLFNGGLLEFALPENKPSVSIYVGHRYDPDGFIFSGGELIYIYEIEFSTPEECDCPLEPSFSKESGEEDLSMDFKDIDSMDLSKL